MGIGDEIIASGHAKTAYYANDKRPVLICDVHGRPRWSGMWEGIPWIVHPLKTGPKQQAIKNGPRCRPYIDYVKGFSRARGLNYSGWRVRDNLGWIELKAEEIEFATKAVKDLGPFVIVEPIVKPGANPNKQWGHAKWVALADLLKREGLNPIQVGPPTLAFRIGSIPHILTPDFRHGVAVMKFARWSFLPDGGLHHAAGVLGLPATVLWGGTNDPNILGYPDHENIFFPAVCGRWTPCPHCQRIWQWLKPDYVLRRTKPRLARIYG